MVLGAGWGRYGRGSGVGGTPLLIGPFQVPLPLMPGVPVMSNSVAVTRPPPVTVTAVGGLESAMSGAVALIVMFPAPVSGRDPGPVGVAPRSPALGARPTARGAARAGAGT